MRNRQRKHTPVLRSIPHRAPSRNGMVCGGMYCHAGRGRRRAKPAITQPLFPDDVYDYLLAFLASNPTREEVLAFRPTDAMQQRLSALLARQRTQALTPPEHAELDAYAQIEHRVIQCKIAHLVAT